MFINFKLQSEALLIFVFIGFFLFKRWQNNRPRPAVLGSSGASLILTMYTMGVGLEKLSEGVLNGHHYRLMITTPLRLPQVSNNWEIDGTGSSTLPTNSLPDGVIRSPVGHTILCVDLPIKSNVHIAGFSLQNSSFRALVGNTSLDNSMTVVELEGNFPDHFKLYCDTNHEIELRQVLDPSRMTFLIDFCNRLNWEIHQNSLYFVQSESTHDTNTNMIQSAQDFAQKILPTLERMAQTKDFSVKL